MDDKIKELLSIKTGKYLLKKWWQFWKPYQWIEVYDSEYRSFDNKISTVRGFIFGMGVGFLSLHIKCDGKILSDISTVGYHTIYRKLQEAGVIKKVGEK